VVTNPTFKTQPFEKRLDQNRTFEKSAAKPTNLLEKG